VYTAPLALLPGLSCPKYAGRPQAPQTTASMMDPRPIAAIWKGDLLVRLAEVHEARRVHRADWRACSTFNGSRVSQIPPHCRRSESA
jgi:hypothetical protein